jgi:hypothetical protein
MKLFEYMDRVLINCKYMIKVKRFKVKALWGMVKIFSALKTKLKIQFGKINFEQRNQKRI